MTHAGESYDCRTREEFEAMAEQERSLTVRAAERLRAAGFGCRIVSVGSTPTLHFARGLEGVTEVRAGVYAFDDLVQAELGTCAMDDIAIRSARERDRPPSTTRPGTDRRRLPRAVSRDRGTADMPLDWGYGAVCDPAGKSHRERYRLPTNQEHGIITSRCGEIDFERFPVGRRVKVLPNHACATAAAYDRYFVTNGSERIVDVWDRVNGW